MKSFLITVSVLVAASVASGQSAVEIPTRGLSFLPDYALVSSNIGGLKKLGKANWRVEGENVAGATESGVGGLLLLTPSWQDAAVNLLFQCGTNAEAGVVFRLRQNDDGFQGVLVSLKDGVAGSWAIAFDAQGREVRREELRPQTGYPLTRLGPPADPNAPTARNSSRNASRGNRSTGDTNSPLSRPDTAFQPDRWNQLEIFLDLNVVRAHLNDGGQTAVGIVEDSGTNFGGMALYAGGQGEVRFREVRAKDLSRRSMPEEKVSPRFRAQRVSDMYYSWGAAAADFNHDGVMDIAAGPYIYFGPDFTQFREIYPALPFNPAKDFTDVNCQYAFDFNGDGWPDILTGPPNATLYVNPKGESRRWDKYVVVPGIQTEVTLFRDVDGSGVPALIYGKNGALSYAKPSPENPLKWLEHPVSEKGLSMAHGLGVGDINGDGRVDILNPNGWWEQPATNAASTLWIYHPQAFARYGHRSTGAGGATMGVYDVNDDGRNDVVTALNAHGFGLAWFEQKRDASGDISFVRHMISDDYSTKNAGDVTFSQPHGSTFADVDGDGVPDFIVGKRYWSHLDLYFDPDPYGPPVLYWYRTVRNPAAPGGAEFVPELIHNRSGAGSDITATDLNGDGKVDIITSTDRGTFIFWNGQGTAPKRP